MGRPLPLRRECRGDQEPVERFLALKGVVRSAWGGSAVNLTPSFSSLASQKHLVGIADFLNNYSPSPLDRGCDRGNFGNCLAPRHQTLRCHEVTSWTPLQQELANDTVTIDATTHGLRDVLPVRGDLRLPALIRPTAKAR